MNSLAMWSMAVGFFLPVVAQFVTRVTPNRSVQSLIGTGCCAIAAAVTAYFAPHSSLTAAQFTKAFGLTFVAAMSSYEHLWKPTNVAPKPNPPAKVVTPAQ